MGPRTRAYESWKRREAQPYLDALSGHRCAHCPSTTNLEIDHIKPRSTHPHLLTDLSNIQYLCHDCHQIKTTTVSPD